MNIKYGAGRGYRTPGRLLLMLLCFAQALYADDGANAPGVPEAIMDFDILAGLRPTFTVIEKVEIVNLLRNPPAGVDLVEFNFEPESLSTAQLEVIKEWIGQGANAIYLKDLDIWRYASLFGLAGDHRIGLLEGGRISEPVNYLCQRVFFGNTEQYFKRYFYFIELKSGAKPVVEDDQGHPVCGKFLAGNSTVFFCNSMAGPDSQRCSLNYWRWVLKQLPEPAKTVLPPPPTPRGSH